MANRSLDKLQVCLVETSLPGSYGSMPAYADMLVNALESNLHSKSINVNRINLMVGLPPWLMQHSSWSYRLQILWLMHRSRKRLTDLSADIVHIVDGSQAHLGLSLKNTKYIVTSHDIIPLLQAKGRFDVPPPGIFARWLIKRSLKGLRKAEQIVSDSTSTSKDLENVAGLNGNRIHIIHLPVRLDLQKAIANKDVSTEIKIERTCPIVLHVGNNGFYKNRVGVVRIFRKIRNKMSARLIMVGPPPHPELVELIKKAGLVADVEFVENPPVNHLADLYFNANLFFFPSLYEGYGWPPLEAMACGCPVVCSNVASLPEVVGDAALTCDPADEGQMAQLCISVLENQTLAQSLSSKGLERSKFFTTEKMGCEILTVYGKVFDTDLLADR